MAIQDTLSPDVDYRFLFESNPQSMWVFDVETLRFLAVNESAVEMYGYSHDEFLAMTVEAIHPPDDIAALHEALQRLQKHQPVNYSWRHVKKDGTYLFVEVKSHLTRWYGRNARFVLIHDVTKRALAEQALRLSEEKLRTLMDATKAGIFFYRGDHFSYVNSAMEQITGYSKEELLQQAIWDFIDPDQREIVKQRSYARQRGEEVPPRYEVAVVSKQGKTLCLDLSISMIEVNSERALMGTLIDITERKKAEEELRRSEELTHRILEAVPGGILEIAQNGRILRANIEAQRFFGLTALDLFKSNISSFADKFLWEDGTKVAFADFPIVKCLRTGEDQDPLTLGVQRPDGSISWAVSTAVPLLDIATGAINGAVFTLLDITGRKQTEDALRDSEERYRKFFEEDLTGDFIAGTEGCLLACNQAFANIFGFDSVKEAMYANLHAIYSGTNAFENIVRMLREQKKIVYHETVGKRVDGQPVYVIENLIGLFDESETLVGVKGYVFDNTAHKLLEQQLQEAQKIESLGRLAGGIAHDFNNLLGIILGYSERLAGTLHGRSNHMSDVVAINTAAQRGANLVKQLLTFARKTSVAFETMNINSIVEELAGLLQETFPRTISLVVDIDPSIPPIVADANQIHQAVLNLCVNARDAMLAGGILTLRTEIVAGSELRLRYADAHADFYACLSVSDNGIGMDAETRSKIFEPFFSTKELGRGTGLGLAVVHGIVKGHRGIIDVASEQGKGATFSLFFPIHSSISSLPMAEEQQAPEAPGGTETILLVEDEELLLELAQTLLESKGYSILTARDGKSAVELYKQHVEQIDLVLTDLGLPNLSGWQACQQMKAVNPKLKVIIATGYLDPAAKQDMMENGIEEFVQKPYLATELIAKVREILDAQKEA